MRLAFTRCDTLPTLSWCAHLRRGSAVAHVYHGPWVETRDDWFVEGAWTGPFENGELDTALSLAGSGGVIREGRAVFCTPTDTIERLYSIRVGNDLFVSNSMVFVLAMAGDELDPRYPFYSYTMHRYGTEGLHRKYKVFGTRRGRRLQWHEYCQVAVGDDLRLVRVEKPVFPRPATFEAYVSMLRGVLAGVMGNAASRSRVHRRYEGVAMVTAGYDSNAVAALLSELGVREAVTVYDDQPGVDSGEEIARLLGMTVHAYGRTDFRSVAAVDEAEFLASWPGNLSDIVLGVCEPRLVGMVFASGRNGDVVFGQDPSLMLDAFRSPRPGGGSRMQEFRLRVGFLNFHPLFSGAQHLSAMLGISLSDEMAPWRLGGDYDRPIARRILEDAGVPRGTFGTKKYKSAFWRFTSPAEMSPASRTDFESYRRSMPPPGLWPRGLVTLRSARDAVTRMVKRVSWTTGKRVESLIPSLSQFQEWGDMDFAIHWGQARVRPRYAEAVAALEADSSRATMTAASHG